MNEFISPVLQNEINAADYNEPNSNRFYTDEIKKLNERIRQSFNEVDKDKTGKITQEDLLNFLRSKVPPNKTFSRSNFLNLLKDVDRNPDNTIDLSEFTRKYIQIHEELKYKIQMEKDKYEKIKNQKDELEKKINENRDEKLINGMCENSQLIVKIGKLIMLNQYIDSDCYLKLLLEENSLKTTSSPLSNLNYNEELSLKVKSKDSKLIMQLYTINSNEPVGSIEIPLVSLPVNEESNPEIMLNDFAVGVCALKPKLVFITSFYDYYQKQYEFILPLIEESQKNIRSLVPVFEGISDPFKYIFDECNIRGPIGLGNAIENKLADNCEIYLKKIFRVRNIVWINTCRNLLYFCIFVTFVTTMDKKDFISIISELIMVLLINSNKEEYLFNYFWYIYGFFLSSLIYDIIDLVLLRKIFISGMKGIIMWVKVFSIIGVLAKGILALFLWICKEEYSKKLKF